MKKEIIKPSILPGFMELLPKEQEIFNDLVNKITKVYEQNGCQAMDTPIIEKAEVLLAKTGGETEKQVYRFEKGKNDLALRFDLTVPFARYAAQYYNDLTFPFKRYQIGKVYRGERNQKGRYREFYQCDVDVIGKDNLSIHNDAWVISLVDQVFKEIGLKAYKFQLSNRKIFKGLLEALNIDNVQEVMILVDKYDKIGKEAFLEEMQGLVGAENSQYLAKVLGLEGSNEEILEALLNLNIGNETFNEGIEELKKVISTLKMLGVNEEVFIINLKIIRGLDYYTGTVFETLLIGNEQYGSICSGGRYASLAEHYTQQVLPGVGISIGLTRLFFVLKEIGFVDQYKVEKPLEYLILPIGETLAYCIKVLKALQNKGHKSVLYLEEDSLKKKMKYADKIEAVNVVLIGEEEVAAKQIKIKNMKTGESQTIDFDSL